MQRNQNSHLVLDVDVSSDHDFKTFDESFGSSFFDLVFDALVSDGSKEKKTISES